MLLFLDAPAGFPLCATQVAALHNSGYGSPIHHKCHNPSYIYFQRKISHEELKADVLKQLKDVRGPLK